MPEPVADAQPTMDWSQYGSFAPAPGAAPEQDWSSYGTFTPHRETSSGSQLLTGYENSLAAAAQLTTPNIAAHEKNYLGPATITETGDVGYKDPQGQFVPTDRNKHIVLTDPADNTPKVYARSIETDEGRAAAAGRILESGLGASTLPGAGMAATRAAPAFMQGAERIGVDVPKAMAGGPVARFFAATAGKVPGGSPMAEGMEKVPTQLGGAIGAAQDIAGGEVSAQTAGGAVREGFYGHYKPAIKKELDDAYTAVGQAVDPNVRSPLTATQGAVADILTRRQEANIAGNGKAVDLITDAITAPGGMTYNGIKNLRTSIGERIDSGFLPEDMSGAELKQIYKGLTEDLGNSVKAAGDDRASALFQRANAMAKQTSAWSEQLTKVLGSEGPAGRSDEGIAQTIYNMAQKGGSADAKTLALARSAVPPKAWEAVASNAISRLGRDKTGNFSPLRFLSDYGNLSDAGKRILFGSVGGGDLIRHLDDIAQVSQRFKDVGKLGNPSGTAHTALTWGAVLESVASLMHGSFIGPMTALAAYTGNNMLARWFSSPATVASLARWSRAYEAMRKRPGPGAIASFNIANRNLANTTGYQLPAASFPKGIVSAPASENEGQPSVPVSK